MPVKVTLHRLDNANESQIAIMEKGRAALHRAVNHPDFKKKVQNAKFKESWFLPKGGRRVQKSPAEIVEIILSGIERDQQPQGGKHDGEIDLAIRLDNIPRPVVGSTTPGRLPFRTAFWFVDQASRRNDSISPARHMMHEWLHVAGFVHKKNDGRREDVPYMVGDIVRQVLKDNQQGLAEDLLNHEDPDLASELDSAEEELMISYSEYPEDDE